MRRGERATRNDADAAQPKAAQSAGRMLKPVHRPRRAGAIVASARRTRLGDSAGSAAAYARLRSSARDDKAWQRRDSDPTSKRRSPTDDEEDLPDADRTRRAGPRWARCRTRQTKEWARTRCARCTPAGRRSESWAEEAAKRESLAANGSLAHGTASGVRRAAPCRRWAQSLPPASRGARHRPRTSRRARRQDAPTNRRRSPARRPYLPGRSRR